MRREELDADRFEEMNVFSKYQSGDRRYTVTCSLCNDRYFTDRINFDRFMRSVEEGMENPFICPDCEVGYQELEHAGH